MQIKTNVIISPLANIVSVVALADLIGTYGDEGPLQENCLENSEMYFRIAPVYGEDSSSFHVEIGVVLDEEHENHIRILATGETGSFKNYRKAMIDEMLEAFVKEH